MYKFKYGGKRGKTVKLKESPDKIVVRTKGNKRLKDIQMGNASREVMQASNEILSFPEAGISVRQLAIPEEKDAKTERDHARTILKEEESVRFAGRVLEDAATGEVMLYTENFFVKFKSDVADEHCLSIIAKYGLAVKMKLPFAEKSWFVAAPEGTGLKTFDIAETILKEQSVELCHPEMIQERRSKSINPMLWHLAASVVNGVHVDAHISIMDAWKITKGKGTTIAIIDDGVDINHPEFKGRIVHPRDVTLNIDDPNPKEKDDNHGTPCAGVAVAAGIKASGTAPEAYLMPIRLRNGLGSMAEAQAFAWAADHGADVISCSWGPADGRWWDPMDPTHTRKTLLPDSTRLAIDYAMSKGRNGKGCVVLFAAGNGNESTENDGYVSYPPVIAVAACNDTSKRSIYSDYGKAVWVSFPSRDFGFKPFQHPNPITPGIFTTDRLAADGYQTTDYHEQFSGTSSACPGVAGVVSLMIAANPNLTPVQIKEILRTTSDKIDPTNGEYDANGHSIYYGYGRINASKAVLAAQKMAAPSTRHTEMLTGKVRYAKAGDQVFRSSTIYKAPSRDKITGLQIAPLPAGLILKTELNFGTGTTITDASGALVGTTDPKGKLIGMSFTLAGEKAAEYLIEIEAGTSKNTSIKGGSGTFIGSKTKTGKTIQWFKLHLTKK